MRLIIYLLSVFLFISCSSDSGQDPSEPATGDFERSAMLAHWANDMIIPAYADLNSANQDLNQKIIQFTDNPSTQTLLNARHSFQQAYITWQKAAFYEVGPAKNENLRLYFNIYPTNAEKIHNMVGESDYQLHLTSNAAIQGYPAIDYLLNGIAPDDAQILAKFDTDAQAQHYKRFIKTLAGRLKEKTETVYSQWPSYKNTFIQNDGSSATSSVDLIVNDYLLFYEKYYRNGKIRIPVGYSTGDPLPDHVEAYYSPELSKELLLTATQAMHDFFQGKNYNNAQKSLGLQQYLEALNKDDIASDINNQFAITKTIVADLNANLQEAVVNDRINVLNLHDKIQENVIFLKSDMLQALNISVAYFDGDGD